MLAKLGKLAPFSVTKTRVYLMDALLGLHSGRTNYAPAAPDRSGCQHIGNEHRTYNGKKFCIGCLVRRPRLTFLESRRLTRSIRCCIDDNCDLGFDRTELPLFRYLAADHQHGNDSGDVPDRVFDPKHTKRGGTRNTFET